VSWIVPLIWVTVKCIYCLAGLVFHVYYELLSLWFIIRRTRDHKIDNYHHWCWVWRTGLVAFRQVCISCRKRGKYFIYNVWAC
jgi:hypothetical protein